MNTPSHRTPPPAGPSPARGHWLNVPIRSLGPAHRDRIRVHLQQLDARDRYLRFGYAASDEQVDRYVDGLDFERDDIFGIYNRKLQLLAVAHLAHSPGENRRACAEFGVSVLQRARGRGYGARLFERAAMHARNEGVRLLFIHALSENTVMLRIARNAGARVERDGSESDAYLSLPEPDLDSRMHELMQEQYAQIDYQLKEQARQFNHLLSGLRQWMPADTPSSPPVQSSQSTQSAAPPHPAAQPAATPVAPRTELTQR